jgi:hypothetical protein
MPWPHVIPIKSEDKTQASVAFTDPRQHHCPTNIKMHYAISNPGQKPLMFCSLYAAQDCGKSRKR